MILSVFAQAVSENPAPPPEPLSFPLWTLVPVLVVCCIAALVMSRALDSNRRRGERLGELCATRGYSYSYEDRWALAATRFGPLARTARNDFVNVVSIPCAGGFVRSFDVLMWGEVEVDDNGRQVRSRSRAEGPRMTLASGAMGYIGANGHPVQIREVSEGSLCGALVPAGCWLPELSVRPENLLTKAAGLAGLPDIKFESEAFNRAFVVQCRARSFAEMFLDAQVIDLMVTLGSGYGLEVQGSWMMLWTSSATPEQLVGLAEAGVELTRRVPDLVRQRFPLPSTVSA